MKRPGAEYFLQQMAQYYEVVIYTASLSKVSTILTSKGSYESLGPLDTKSFCFRINDPHALVFLVNFVVR